MILEIKHMAHGSSLQLIPDTPLGFWFGAAWPCIAMGTGVEKYNLNENEIRDRRRATD